MASILEEGYLIKDNTMTIEKVTALLQSKNTSMNFQRHRQLIKKLIQNAPCGFVLQDVSKIRELICHLAERVKHGHQTEYELPLLKLINICSMPFLKMRTSDGQTYSSDVVELLSILGKLCWSCEKDSIRCEIARTITSLYKGLKHESVLSIPKGLQQISQSYLITHIENSGLASSLVLSLHYTGDMTTLVLLLETLVLLSVDSSKNCDSILSVKGATFIAEEYISSPSREVQSIAVELLWNLLENGSQIQVSEQLSTFKTISSLQILFKELMFSSTTLENKQFRSDVLMIVMLIASKCTNAPFVETQFLKEICEYATFSETDYSHTRPYRCLYDSEDFDLQKGLMCLLVSLSSLPAAPKVLSSYKAVRLLMQFAVPNDVHDFKWSPAKFEELQLLALSSLSTIAPRCIEDYMSCQGNTRMLILIEWSSKETGFRSQGNSYHGTGGRNTKYSQLSYSLQLLLRMCSIDDNEVILQDLHEQGIIPLLIGILKNFQALPNSDSNPLMMEIQSHSLLILSLVCEQNIHRKELFGGYDGVPVLVHYLKTDKSQSLIDEAAYYKLLKTTIDCVWSSVIGHGSVEDMFLEQSGIFALLNILHTCPYDIKRSILTVVVDFCESNQKSIDHVSVWSTKGGVNTWTLIAQLWREEEKKLGVPRGEKGTLVGTTLPLIGAAQSAQGMPPAPTKNITAAIEDVSDNLRAKLYSLYTKIGPAPAKSNISTEDKVTFCIIENYLDFKTGEVWYEVASELAHDKIRPSSPDQESLQEIFHCAEERAEEITRQQHELIDEQHRRDLDEEYQFYEQLRDAQLSSERAQEKEEKLMLRTSNYKNLKEAKEKQTMAIDASRPSAVSLGERFHSTNQSSLNVTTFCGRHVTVETSPVKLLNNNDMNKSPTPPSTP